MADRRRAGLNNQRRVPNVAHASLVESDVLLTGSQYTNLPKRSLVTGVSVVTTTVSGTGGANVDVVVNGTVIADNVPITVATTVVADVIAAAAYLPTGGVVEVRSGDTAPANGAFIGDLIVTYIELDKRTGEYTN